MWRSGRHFVLLGILIHSFPFVVVIVFFFVFVFNNFKEELLL